MPTLSSGEQYSYRRTSFFSFSLPWPGPERLAPLLAEFLFADCTLRRRFERAKSEGDLPNGADAADLARFVTALFQGMTVQAINGARRDDLLRLSDAALRIWPK
jgi:hypothetical protein